MTRHKFDLEFHPASQIFPLMQGKEFQALADDIRAHGLREPIVRFEKQIIDGRNRYRACKAAGVEPFFVEWDGIGSPIDFVLSANLHRRHMDESQRAMAAAQAKGMFEAEAAERMRAGKKSGQKVENTGENSENDPSANLREGKASEQAAEVFDVSPRSVELAAKVIEEGSAALVEAVQAGDVAVSDAAKIVDRPAKEQAAAVTAVKAGKAKTVAAAVKEDDAEPPAQTDAEGNAIPAKLRPVFARVKEFGKLLRILTDCAKEVERLAADKQVGGYLHAQSTVAEINNAKRAIKFARPHAVCPYCKARGDSCKCCKGRGWVPSNLYSAAPGDMK